MKGGEKPRRRLRYSISVSRRTYHRLQAVVSPGDLAGIVNALIVRALNASVSASASASASERPGDPLL